jgi:hypothetical protein
MSKEPPRNKIARAENLLRENKVEVMKQLRARQGLSPVKTIRRSIQLYWSRDAEVAKQRRFQKGRSEYHQWNPEELEALRQYLKEGDIVRPTYAFSLYIKRGSEEIHYRKDGVILQM